MSIIRIDHKRTHGFQVKIQRNGKEYSKLFSDKKYGGTKKAYLESKKYEKKLIETHGVVNKHHDFKRIPKNNTSGILGVSKTHQHSRGKIIDHIFVWQASWVDPVTYKKMNCSFSENKYGAKKAKEMAIACRKHKKNLFRKK